MINNPYQTTPMMNNNYMPMQNPYADRMNFLQNYQQSLQQQPMQMNQQPMPQQIAGINGRIVQAVENLFNVSAQAYVDVPCGCCSTVAVQNTSTQAIEVQNSNLIAVREA